MERRHIQELKDRVRDLLSTEVSTIRSHEVVVGDVTWQVRELWVNGRLTKRIITGKIREHAGERGDLGADAP